MKPGRKRQIEKFMLKTLKLAATQALNASVALVSDSTSAHMGLCVANKAW